MTFETSLNGASFQIFNADCVKGMSEHLQPQSVDVIVTSPPYNLGIKYGQYDDTGPRQEYLQWINGWAAAVKAILRDNGSLFLNIGSKPSDPFVPFDVLMEMREHFCLQNVIHWIKSIAIDAEEIGKDNGLRGGFSVGHYKPINSQRFINDCHEYIFHLTKTGDVELDRKAVGVEYQDKTNVSRWNTGNKDVRCRGNTWLIPYRTIQSRDKERPHPATFPVKLPKMCIRLHGLEKAKLVVDTFLGIGHTALACAELGVDFAGFEMDEQYYLEACTLLSSQNTLFSDVSK